MRGKQEVVYRLNVAQGFLVECQQDVTLQRWRSAVDNGQLAIEHATKAVLAMIGPVGRTHNPATPYNRRSKSINLFPRSSAKCNGWRK